MRILAIDIGGTNIKYALWENSSLGEVRETPTPRDSLNSLIQSLKTIEKEFDNLEGIAISMPGFIDVNTGIAHTGGALDYINELEVEKLLKKELQLPVVVENDAKAATLAEMKEGCLVDKDNAIMIVLGTGVGGTVVVDKKIVRGAHLLSGELSFFNANIEDKDSGNFSIACLCGAQGLSDCVAKTSKLSGLNGREIFGLIEEGNEKVLEGLKKYCSRLAWLLYNLEVVTDPEVFAIGGGISRQPLLIELIKEELDKQHSYPLNSLLEVPEVRACKFMSDANLIGAAHNFLERRDSLE